MTDRFEYHVLSHTHWDREWYQTFQQFRLQLVHLLDDLMDLLENDPDFKHFHLDGQTIPLEDYLAVRPDREKRLARLVKQGRIAVGPWYVLSDLNLTHGESTLRNLQVGHAIARRFGKVCKVGYLPDQFGNISQMPQILRGFGIRYAVFGRGYVPGGERKAEIEWRSPDGSKVFALFLPSWYCNFQRPPEDAKQAWQYFREACDKLLPHSTTPYLLLMNGCDHLNAQANLPGILHKLNRRLKQGTIIHTRLEDYLKKVAGACKSPTPWQGEFREDHRHQVLAGTLSSRVYLKQANARCEQGLLSAETLMLWRSLCGGSYDLACLDLAWKMLLANHAHDSICGCSIDPVHREMVARFEQVEQMAAEMRQESLEHLAGRIRFPARLGRQDRGLLVANPLAVDRKEVLEVAVDIPLSEPVRRREQLKRIGPVPKQIRVLDEQGEAVPFHLHGSEETALRVLSPSVLPCTMEVKRFHLQIPVELKSLEYRSFYIQPRPGKAARPRHRLRGGNNRLENAFVRVTVSGDGSLNIRHKATGHLYGPLLVFEDGGDVGDEYLYRCPGNDRVVTTAGRPAQVRPVSMTPLQGTLQVERILPLPETADLREERRPRQTVGCLISTRITLRAEDPTLYCETRLDNQARFHRLRALFQANLPAETALADAPFDQIERPARLPEAWEEAATQFPLRSFVAVEHEAQGLAVLTRGLHEYELVDSERGTLALTLLRCVGHLEWRKQSHYVFETPEAQCLGVQRFEFAVCAYGSGEERAALPRRAEALGRPVETLEFAPGRGRLKGGARRASSLLPRQQQLLQVEPVEVLVTAVRRCEKRDALLVRLVNLSEEKVEARLTCGLALKEAHQLDLLERRKKRLDPVRNRLVLSLKAKEIATLELGLSR